MDYHSIIAIDGPAASGKSTLAFRLARSLQYLFFDTGVMYRAVTWLALDRKVGINNEAAVTLLAEEVPIDITVPSLADGRSCDVVVEGQDITWEIRKAEVEANVSIVSAYIGVRKALSLQQRRIGLRGCVVMVGRDIGTVVLPEAGLKIYLDASAEERARRRYQEILSRGGNARYKDILAKVIERDHIDSTRAIAPLEPASDAVILDSDSLSEDEVFEKIYDLCKR